MELTVLEVDAGDLEVLVVVSLVGSKVEHVRTLGIQCESADVCGLICRIVGVIGIFHQLEVCIAVVKCSVIVRTSFVIALFDLKVDEISSCMGKITV